MRIHKTFFWSLPLLATVALPSFAAPEDKSEPAAGYVLQVNGSKLPLTLGAEVASKIAGQQIRFKLSQQPFRQFDKSGVQFQYPTNYVFEADDSQPGAMIWTLTGNNSVIMLQRFGKLSLPTLGDTMVSEMTKQYGEKNVTVSPITLFLKGQKLAGKRLYISLVGQKFVQEIYTFATAQNSFVLVLQDFPDKDKASAENARLKVLMTQSLKWK